LAALTDVLKGEPHALTRFENSVAEMDDLYGPLRLHRFVTRAQPHPADVVDVLRETVPHVRALRPGVEGLRANVGAVRRAVARRHDGTPYRPLPPEADATVHAIDAGLARLHEIYAPPTEEPKRDPKRGPESPEKARPAG
jgi:hypothetical protein